MAFDYYLAFVDERGNHNCTIIRTGSKIEDAKMIREITNDIKRETKAKRITIVFIQLLKEKNI